MTPAVTARLSPRDRILVALGVLVVIALCLLLSPSNQLEKTYHWVRDEPGIFLKSGSASLSGASREALFAALRQVKDPEIGVNIVDLGLVYSASFDSGTVKMVMTLTSPTCPYSAQLIEGAKKALFSGPSVKEVELKLTFEPPWNVNMISPEVREKFFHLKSSPGNG